MRNEVYGRWWCWCGVVSVVVSLLLWESGRSTREEGEKTAEWGLSISVVEYCLRYSRRYRTLGYVSVSVSG